MATIDDVITWANALPAWQGDAVRRLLATGEWPLSSQEYSEILALAKADLKLAPPQENLKPVPPVPGMFSGSPAKTAAIKLLSIDDVRNVNIKASQNTTKASTLSSTADSISSGSPRWWKSSFSAATTPRVSPGSNVPIPTVDSSISVPFRANPFTFVPPARRNGPCCFRST
jgi:hypothetical protein